MNGISSDAGRVQSEGESASSPARQASSILQQARGDQRVETQGGDGAEHALTALRRKYFEADGRRGARGAIHTPTLGTLF